MKIILAALFVAFLGGIVVWKVLDQSISWQIPRLKDPNWEVRSQAAERLWRHGPAAKEAIPALLEALQKEDDIGAALEMAQALGRMGPSSVPTLVDILMENSNRTARIYAAAALETMGPAARSAVPALVLQYDLNDKWLNGRPGLATLKICDDCDEVLIELLKDPDVKTRLLAARALATRTSVASVQEAAAPVLAEALKDPAAEVRKQAAITLGLYGIESEPAIPALRQVQDTDPDPSVRQAAADALAQIH